MGNPSSRTVLPSARLTPPLTAGFAAHLIKEIWAFDTDRIAVRFVYEWHDDSGQWHRSHGNENWAFDADGLMTHRYASINDQPIAQSERLFHWPLGRRPDGRAPWPE